MIDWQIFCRGTAAALEFSLRCAAVLDWDRAPSRESVAGWPTLAMVKWFRGKASQREGFPSVADERGACCGRASTGINDAGREIVTPLVPIAR